MNGWMKILTYNASTGNPPKTTPSMMLHHLPPRDNPVYRLVEKHEQW